MINNISFQGHIYTDNERLRKKIKSSPIETKEVVESKINEFAKTIKEKTPDNCFFIFDFDPGVKINNRVFNASISTQMLGMVNSNQIYMFNIFNQNKNDLSKIFNEYTSSIINKIFSKQNCTQELKGKSSLKDNDFLLNKLSQKLVEPKEKIFFDKKSLVNTLVNIKDDYLRQGIIDNFNRFYEELDCIDSNNYYRIDFRCRNEKTAKAVLEVKRFEFIEESDNKTFNDINNFYNEDYRNDFSLWEIQDKNHLWQSGFAPILSELIN